MTIGKTLLWNYENFFFWEFLCLFPSIFLIGFIPDQGGWEILRNLLLFHFVGFFIYGCFLHMYVYLKVRKKQLQIYAEEKGYSFSAENNFDLLPELTSFEIKGYDKIQNILSKNLESEGIKIKIFSTEYSSGKKFYLPVICLLEAPCSFPDLAMEARTGFEGLKKRFGAQTIKIGSKLYTVKSSDENCIREVFSPDMIDFILKQGNGILFEMHDSFILFNFEIAEFINKEKIDNLVQFAIDFYKELSMKS